MPAIDEAARQRELDGQHLVDSLPEVAYDDIVTLAALIWDAPIALVTLIDRDRQWFKASIGLDDIGSRRDEAFCNHAIAKPDQMMEVPDAHEMHVSPVTEKKGIREHFRLKRAAI